MTVCLLPFLIFIITFNVPCFKNNIHTENKEQSCHNATIIVFLIYSIALIIAHMYEYLNSKVHAIDNLETHEWNQQTILTHNQNPIILTRCTTHNGNYEVNDRFLTQNDSSTNNTLDTILNDNIVESVNNVAENSETSAALSLIT